MTEERLKELKDLKGAAKEKPKGKKFGNLSTKEKDELLETLCKIHGLI